jgi:hypothetical protein
LLNPTAGVEAIKGCFGRPAIENGKEQSGLVALAASVGRATSAFVSSLQKTSWTQSMSPASACKFQVTSGPSGWSVASMARFCTNGAVTTLDRTRRRKAGVVQGSVPPPFPGVWGVAAEWDVLPVNTLDGLGSR